MSDDENPPPDVEAKMAITAEATVIKAKRDDDG